MTLNTVTAEKLVKSRKRVADHGEVYTPRWLVEDMLDLVKQETERIDSRFLEPACGDGNFLAIVLEKKMAMIQLRYRKSQSEFEKYSVVGVASIYGIDILKDNVEACRDRLFRIFETHYKKAFKQKFKENCIKSIKKVLSLNIIHGDALSLKSCEPDPKSIVFAEWSLVNDRQIKRRDFEFAELVATASYNSDKSMPLFSDLGKDVFIPKPIAEHPLTHYLKLHDVKE